MDDMKEKIQTVGSWLNDLSQSLGTDMNLDEDGVCCFQIGQETIIGIEVSQTLSMVHLFSPLLALPEEKEKAERIIIRALEINAFQALTRGGAIGIPPGGGPLLFCYSVPIEGMDSHSFSQLLGNFYEVLPEIKSLINEAVEANAPNPFKEKEKASLSRPTAHKIFIKI